VRLALVLILLPVVAHAQPAPDSSSDDDPIPAPNYEPWTLRMGGFIQPQFREKQQSVVGGDTPGFRMARTRLTATGDGRAGNLELNAYVEAELQPQFSLFDAFVTVGRKLPDGGHASLDMGQTRVPISRQQLESDTRLAFVEKAQLASIAPDRDLGARLTIDPPDLPYIRVIGGVFNGEGRNQVENINDSYLYAGRLEFSPWGRDIPLTKYQESMFAGRMLTAAVSVGHNKLTEGTKHERQTFVGYDLAFAFRGFSGTFEYLQVLHRYDTAGDPATLPPEFDANGWVAQLNYMIPIKLPPFHESRFEVGARVEEIDRNNAVSIVMPGDPNQSERLYTAVVSYYLRGHTMKAQLAATHFTDIENQTVTGADATYKHDQVLLQVTYRVE
jgi:hypothetical protein